MLIFVPNYLIKSQLLKKNTKTNFFDAEKKLFVKPFQKIYIFLLCIKICNRSNLFYTYVIWLKKKNENFDFCDYILVLVLLLNPI